MKKNIFAIVGCIALILSIGVFLSFTEDTSAQNKDRWEYKIVFTGSSDAQFVADMNKLGDEGWELAGIQQPPELGRPFGHIFKRRK